MPSRLAGLLAKSASGLARDIPCAQCDGVEEDGGDRSIGAGREIWSYRPHVALVEGGL